MHGVNNNPIHFDAAQAAHTEFKRPLVDSTFTLALITGVLMTTIETPPNPAEQEVRTFVGKNADYYLAKWDPVLDGSGNAGNVTGFNWAAFFLSGLWLPYRKMYRAASIFFGVVILETLLEDLVFIKILGKPEAPGFVGTTVGLIAALVCGGFGNAWYLSHTRENLAEVRSRGLTGDAHARALAARGGTSVASALAFVLGSGLVAFMASFLFYLLMKGL